MYSSFFKFSEKPFEVTPDPKYFYASPSHKEMLASLVYGIRERRGFICLTGEVGTGKTMLINSALDRFDESTKVAYISNTALTFNQLLLVTLEELEILEPGKQISKLKSIRLLNEFALGKLSEGGNVVLIVDEAQNLDADSMENLRLLSNLETRKHKLIQIVLSGQPELDTKLDRPDLRQLTQRISVRRQINSLTEAETYAYMKHRLDVAGYRGPELFKNEAQKMVYEYSCGIPRKINILCDNALLIGFALEKREIDGDCVAEAARDLKWEPTLKAVEPVLKPVEPASSSAVAVSPQPAAKRVSPRMALAGGMALAAALLVGAWIAFGRSGSDVSVTLPSFSEPNIQTGLNLDRQNGGQPGPGPTSLHADKADLPKQVRLERQANSESVASSSLVDKERKGPELEKQKGAIQAGAASELEAALPMKTTVREIAEPASEIAVVAERNDSLSEIIQRTYGRYTDRLLAKVLKENPEIRRPNFILEGQKIRLPELEPKDLDR